MIYNDDFLVKRKKETDQLLHFLQQCKFSGSWDTKIDLNVVIKNIAQSSFIIDELSKEVTKLSKENKEMKLKQVVIEKPKNIEGVSDQSEEKKDV